MRLRGRKALGPLGAVTAALSVMLLLLTAVTKAQQDYILDKHPNRVEPIVQELVARHLPPHLLHLYDTKCHNGIVGLFCEGNGCYYNSDCFDGHCNMYSKCERRVRNQHITEMEKQMHLNNAM